MPEIDIQVPKDPPPTNESVAEVVAVRLSLQRGPARRPNVVVEQWTDVTNTARHRVPCMGTVRRVQADQVWLRVVYTETEPS